MPLNLINLDTVTRQQMILEVDYDVQNGKLYQSSRLSPIGLRDYETLLREAINNHDDSWLANQLRMGGRLNETETRRTKSGVTIAKVPITAPDTLAEGEFNRFYARGLCLRAINENIPNLVIYRAKLVSEPRPDSQAKLGTTVNPQSLLNDLRTNIGVEPALGLPPGPNSGLSVSLP